MNESVVAVAVSSERTSGYPPTEEPLERLQVINELEKVSPPAEGLVYSTDPQTALLSDAHRYIVKGPDPKVVFSEAVSYELASLIDLPVPNCVIATIDGTDSWFGSHYEPFRFAIEEVHDQGLIENPEILRQTVVLDIWIANHDRNVGNFVARSTQEDSARVQILPIDFEKARVLRGEGSVALNMYEPTDYWPNEALTSVYEGISIPEDTCDIIESMDSDLVIAAIDRVLVGMNSPDIPWLETTRRTLLSRADSIHSLTQDSWP